MPDAEETELPGVVCPKCGKRNLAAAFVRHKGKATIRVRQCRKCGHRVRTIERIREDMPSGTPLPHRLPPAQRVG